MDVHWTGRTILSRQRILKANLDMSGVSRRGQGVAPRKIEIIFTRKICITVVD